VRDPERIILASCDLPYFALKTTAKMGLHGAPPIDYAVRLADEGVPLRAIARACCIPSDDLRQVLWEAKNDGRLIALPLDEWPPGFPREIVLEASWIDRDLMLRRSMQQFRITATQARLLLALLQRTMVPRTRLDVGGKAMDVHVHALRKALKDLGVKLETLWGYGYKLSGPDRRKVTKLILQHVAAARKR
jgi:hypothetical protein